MHQLMNAHRLIFALVVSCAITSCSKSAEIDSTDSGLLQYVPADTPYLFSSLEPLPDEVMDKMEPIIELSLKGYADVLRAIANEEIEKAEEEGEVDGETLSRLQAIGNEIASLLSIEGLNNAGIDRNSLMVIYGEGLLPVFRMRLTDGALMEQAIARIEEKAGSKMATGKIDDQSYRYAGDDDAFIIVALVGNDLVITMLPAVHSDDLLKSVLGLNKPAKSMAESGGAKALIAKNNYEPYFLFFIDFTRIVSTFLDEQSGSNAELLALTEYDPSTLSDVCKAEIRDMAGIVPRMTAGYTKISTHEMSSAATLEVREDIAAGLATLVAPVQGLGLTKGGLFSFGMSLDVLAAREFYSSRLDAMEAAPYECELFAELQAGVEQGRELLKQPIPPIAYSVKGFLAVIDALEGMDLVSQQPPTSVDASFLLATDNPQGLVAMGALFSPEIAALDLQADGKPQQLNLPPISPALSEAHIAMTEDSLVISVGEGGADRIVEMLKAGYAEPPPSMSMFMDAGRYYGFVADLMMLAPPTEEDASPELTAAMAEMTHSMEDWFDEISVSISLTDRGVELESTVTFAEEE